MAATITGLRKQILANIAILDVGLVNSAFRKNPYIMTLLVTGTWDVIIFSDMKTTRTYTAQLTLESTNSLHMKAFTASTPQPTRIAALQDLLRKSQAAVDTQTQAGQLGQPMPGYRKTAGPSSSYGDDFMEEMTATVAILKLSNTAEKEWKEAERRAKLSAEAERRLAKQEAAEAKRKAREQAAEAKRQAKGKSNAAAPATTDKKRKCMDEDEDDEEFRPVKQQSPEEKKVKLEAGSTLVKQSGKAKKVKLAGR